EQQTSGGEFRLKMQKGTLSSKRELFFKQDGSSTGGGTTAGSATGATTNGSVTSNSTTMTTTTGSLSSSRENILNSRTEKESSSYSRVDRERSASSTRDNKETYNSLTSASSNAKNIDGYVGFANLPNQVYRKAVKKGFDFTIMVVGEAGLGKSTLMNSMFLTDIYSPDYPGPSLRIKKTVEVETTKVLLKENGVNLTLTIVDTPGFGDAVDNSNCWQPILEFIEAKYEDYLNAESRVNRKMIVDSRVHSCLYFITPSGHGLKPLDIEFMKRLHDKVNIIPLIAKADTMTPEEVMLFKKTILNEVAQHKIKIYEFPDCDDEEENKIQKPLRDRVPFAVVGSNTIIESNGKKVRGRKYPWGVVEVENLEHCDFIALRNMIVRTHMQDLKDVTNNVHYENYRCRKLAGVSQDGKVGRMSNKNPLAQMEDEKKEHQDKIKKMEQDMENVFEMKVKEKKQKLKDSETDLQRRH
ncbi:SEPT7 (predicted), partial [Pycnogonum litorale]